VFQRYAPFAQISVAQDIAFGAEMQGMNRKSGGIE
jgi:ABC-type sulfate/molybdate transport systems ATPase subunit